MTKSVPVHLGAVQETLPIPLLARARDTERRRGLLRDPRAVQFVRSLDYDFDRWEGGRSLAGAPDRERSGGLDPGLDCRRRAGAWSTPWTTPARVCRSPA